MVTKKIKAFARFLAWYAPLWLAVVAIISLLVLTCVWFIEYFDVEYFDVRGIQ